MYKEVKKVDLDVLGEKSTSNAYNNLKDGDKEKYVKLYNVYRSLFTKYVINKFDIHKFEKIFKESNLVFKKVETNMMDFYQWYSSDELDYFYLRNNIYIEYLNKDELELLKTLAKNNVSDLNDKTSKFIESTYKKVIFEKIKGDDIINIPYGTMTLKNFHKNNSLVIGFRYDRFAKHELSDEEWFNQDKAKVQTVKMVLNEMNKEYENSLSIPFVVEEYNQYSI